MGQILLGSQLWSPRMSTKPITKSTMNSKSASPKYPTNIGPLEDCRVENIILQHKSSCINVADLFYTMIQGNMLNAGVLIYQP